MASVKQKILELAYPLLMKGSKKAGRLATILQNENGQLFQTPIYELSITFNNGEVVPLRQWEGKKLLLVNTASQCGYTAQYRELQQLQERLAQHVQVIGFPSNDFRAQEPGGDAAIAQFCQVNFGVTFPLAQKSSVVPGPLQHPVYQWLTQPQQNGWNSKAPSWNFCKYLVSGQGVLTHYFDPAISPLDAALLSAVEA